MFKRTIATKFMASMLAIVMLLSVIPTIPQAKAALGGNQIRKVLVLNFDPVFPQAGGKKCHDLINWWSNPQTLSSNFISDMTQISHSYVQYQITDWQELNEMPRGTNGQSYTIAGYYNDLQAALQWAQANGKNYWDWTGWQNFGSGFSFDYDYYLNRFNVYNRIDSGQIDEVWLFTGPMNGAYAYESRMVGRNAYWCNSPGLVKSSNPFLVYGFSFERGVGEMLENAGHAAESILNNVFNCSHNNNGVPYSIPYNSLNDWQKFALYDKLMPGTSGVGNIHFAPNSLNDYDWGNTRYVMSRCNDWANYPNLTGQSQNVNTTTWGNGDMRAHHKWWFNLLPHAAGVNAQSGKQNNWWFYITLDYIINANQTVKPGIVSGASPKCYQFTPTVSGVYTVTSTNSTGLANLDLMNANGQGLGFTLNFFGNDFVGVMSLSANTTYLLRCNTRSGSASYDLTVNPPIVKNQTINVGTVSGASPKYYSFTPTTSGTYTVTSSGSTGLANLDLMTANGQGLGFSLSFTGNNFVGVMSLNANTTYLLRCNTRSGTASYNITVN